MAEAHHFLFDYLGINQQQREVVEAIHSDELKKYLTDFKLLFDPRFRFDKTLLMGDVARSIFTNSGASNLYRLNISLIANHQLNEEGLERGLLSRINEMWNAVGMKPSSVSYNSLQYVHSIPGIASVFDCGKDTKLVGGKRHEFIHTVELHVANDMYSF